MPKKETHARTEKTPEEQSIREWYKWSKYPPISVTHPAIAAQWHPSKNGAIGPDEFTYASGEKVWWKCPHGPDHIWQAAVVQRTKSTASTLGCPFCSGHKPSVTNSLGSLRPDVAQQWHPTKNGKLKPKDVTVGTKQKVWWRCSKNKEHSWQACVSDRTSKSSGCPACIGRQVTQENSLKNRIPDIKRYWHPTKNGALRSEEVSHGASEAVWWKCPKGADHEWKAVISSFTRAQSSSTRGCPFCARRRLSKESTLLIVAPKIAKEWHKLRNGKLKPNMISATSVLPVFWQCPEDKSHVWKGSPYERVKEGRTCTFCRGIEVNESNSLAALRPKVAQQWHPTRNKGLTPHMVTPQSHHKVWWRCLKNSKHVFTSKVVWQAYIDEPRCTKCNPRRVVAEKSLAAKNPELAKEWHPTLNGDLQPHHVSSSSLQRVWWQCPVAEDHFWDQTCHSRHFGASCPFCSGNRVTTSNSLATLRPDLAEEWHPSKNGSLTPAQVTIGTARRVWWKCALNTEHPAWAATVVERANGCRCMACFNEMQRTANPKYSLQSEYPDIANEWHPTKNGDLHPSKVFPKSQKRAWWQCSKDQSHVWDTKVATRTHCGAGCPFCARQRKTP